MDDPAYDSIQHKPGFVKKVVGPVEPNTYIMDISQDRPDVYCSTCTKLVVEKILLEYFDGTKESVSFYFPGYMWDPQSSVLSDWEMVISQLNREHPEFSTSH